MVLLYFFQKEGFLNREFAGRYFSITEPSGYLAKRPLDLS